mgnify:CR=1 FL=1
MPKGYTSSQQQHIFHGAKCSPSGGPSWQEQCLKRNSNPFGKGPEHNKAVQEPFGKGSLCLASSTKTRPFWQRSFDIFIGLAFLLSRNQGPLGLPGILLSRYCIFRSFCFAGGFGCSLIGYVVQLFLLILELFGLSSAL